MNICCFLTESLKRVYFLHSVHFTLDWPHFKYLLAALWDNTVRDYSRSTCCCLLKIQIPDSYQTLTKSKSLRTNLLI